MVNVNFIGRQWGGGDSLARVNELLALIRAEPLDPIYDPFMLLSHQLRTFDGSPIYPAHPGTVRFWGNFLNLSHAFSFDTDDPDLIGRTVEALRANIAMHQYRLAKR